MQVVKQWGMRRGRTYKLARKNHVLRQDQAPLALPSGKVTISAAPLPLLTLSDWALDRLPPRPTQATLWAAFPRRWGSFAWFYNPHLSFSNCSRIFSMLRPGSLYLCIIHLCNECRDLFHH